MMLAEEKRTCGRCIGLDEIQSVISHRQVEGATPLAQSMIETALGPLQGLLRHETEATGWFDVIATHHLPSSVSPLPAALTI